MGLTRPRASQIFDIDYKQATRVITVANITLTGSAPAVVDGVSLVTNDRILVTGQSTNSQNGLYLVSVVGIGSDGTWVRTSDGNETGEIEAGMIIMVTEGVAYHDTQWKLISDNPIIIGTTALVFEPNISSSYSDANVATYLSSGTVSTDIKTTAAISATGNITGSNTNIIGTTASTSRTTGALTVAGGVGVAGDVYAGTSMVVDNAYGSVTTTQYASIFAKAIGSNATSLIQVKGNDGTTGMGMRAVTGSSSLIYSNAAIDLRVGSTIRDLDTPTGGTTIASIASTGMTVTGNISATGNITGNYFLGNGSQLSGVITTVDANTLTGSTLASNIINSSLTSTGTLGSLSVSGNVIGGNISTTGSIGSNLIPAVDLAYSLGNTTHRWANLYLSGNTIYLGNSIITENANGDVIIDNSGSFAVPVGTTAQRSEVIGAIRYNTTIGGFETYDGAGWNKLAYGTASDFPFGNYGSVSDVATTDAFGIALTTTFDCNDPGPLQVTDLGADEAYPGA